MAFKWTQLKNLGDLSDNRENIPDKPGIYVVSRKKPVTRLGGTDKAGIIYTGQTVNLRRRLVGLRNKSHIATKLLRRYPETAYKVLGIKSKGSNGLEDAISQLEVRYHRLNSTSQLDSKERAIIYEYFAKYGEVPPLNFSFPKRMKEAPNKKDLAWSRRVLK